MAAGLVTGTGLYYALGGGLGHLTRARAALNTLGVQARVLCSSPHAADPQVSCGMDLLPLPSEVTAAAFRPWLKELLWKLRPQELYLDCFPAGLFGELCGLQLPPDLRIHHLARLLRWEHYLPLLNPGAPRLHQVYLLEPLAEAHLAWLEGQCAQISPLELIDPPSAPQEETAKRLDASPSPRWLVVHSGPWREVQELLAYARELAAAEAVRPAYILVTPLVEEPLPPDVRHLAIYPAHPLYPLAERIISACGFNLMRETQPFRAKHRFLPLPRRFDDQFARAARCRGL